MEATKRPFRAAAPDNPKTNAADKEREKQICSKREPSRLSVCVIGWVSEVRQIALKEEGIDLKGHARRLKGKVPCLGKPDD